MRLKHIIQYITVFFVLLEFGTPSFAASPDLTEPLSGRLRAGYMSASNIDLVPKMAQIGMNAAVPKFDQVTVPLSYSSTTKLLTWAIQCNKNNMAFMPVINWWTASYAKYLPNYNHVVTDSGSVLSNTPCPYTKSFWDGWITPRVLGIILGVGNHPLDAVLIDMEMYGAEYSNYYRGCYCDNCFSRYMKAKNLSGPLPALADRAKIVKKAGELKFYESLQREEAHTLAASLRKAAQKIHPGLRLGALQLDSAITLQQGIALGFGTPQLPTFCLTETTYSNGYTSNIESAKKTFSNIGAYVDLLVGIWQSRFPPENIPEQLYYCAHDSYGYWVYTMETFANPDYQPLPGTPDEGWSAIKHANQELDKLRVDKNYKTLLQIRSFERPPTPLPWSEFIKFNLVRSQAKAPQSIPAARLRGKNWLYFYADKGETIKFKVVWHRVSNFTDPVRIGLMSPDGTHLNEGTAKMVHSYVLQAIAPISGVYGLMVMSENDANSADIIEASHPYAVSIAKLRGAGFVDKLPPIFVSVVPNAAAVEFEFKTDNSAEAVRGTVFAGNGLQLWSSVIDGPTNVHIINPGAGPLQIRFDKLPGCVLEDIRIRALQGVFPFVATDPAGLLK